MDLNNLKVAELKSLCEALGVKPGAKKADSISAIMKLGLPEEELNKKLEGLGISASAPKPKKSSAKAEIPPEMENRITNLENRMKELTTKISELDNAVKALTSQPKPAAQTPPASPSAVDLGTIQSILKRIQHLDYVLYSKNKTEDELTQDEIEEAKAKIEEAFSKVKTKTMSFDELMDKKEMRDVSWPAVVKALEEMAEDGFVEVSEGASTKKYKDKFGKLTFSG